MVNMFSISELDAASKSCMELIKMSGFGISLHASRRRASDMFAELQAFQIFGVSRFMSGGRKGSELYGVFGSNIINLIILFHYRYTCRIFWKFYTCG